MAMANKSVFSFQTPNSLLHRHHHSIQTSVQFPPFISRSTLPKPVTITCSVGTTNGAVTYVEKSSCDNILKVKDCDSFQSEYEHVSDMAVVGQRAMEKANGTLEDFVRTYFMFHGMEPNSPKAVFQYLPLLLFVESFTYQLDGLNEKILDVGEMLEVNQSQISKLKNVFNNDPFRPVINLLERRGVLTERMKEEFKRGEQYWDLERKMCSALVEKNEISIKSALSAIHHKSFDYRIMNLLLYQLRGEKVNELHMEFMSVSELLVEIKDDLFDYKDDVLENNFNIYRMFVGRYGSSAPIKMRKYINEIEENYHTLLKSLDPQLSLNHQKRREEEAQEKHRSYPESYGPTFAEWIIPPAIEDEESYRSNNI